MFIVKKSQKSFTFILKSNSQELSIFNFQRSLCHKSEVSKEELFLPTSLLKVVLSKKTRIKSYLP